MHGCRHQRVQTLDAGVRTNSLNKSMHTFPFMYHIKHRILTIERVQMSLAMHGRVSVTSTCSGVRAT